MFTYRYIFYQKTMFSCPFFFTSQICRRVTKLTKLPDRIIRGSEPLQVSIKIFANIFLFYIVSWIWSELSGRHSESHRLGLKGLSCIFAFNLIYACANLFNWIFINCKERYNCHNYNQHLTWIIYFCIGGQVWCVWPLQCSPRCTTNRKPLTP